ncbi:transcriptional regulator, AraC family [Alteromonadaceae bacterium Bs31]|nr:transcriptional regulator, AraC family [Alteromonadaceae bacterium Bs31]
MDTVLFNTHDVVLLLTVYQCLLLCAVLLVFSRRQRLSNLFLIGFLLSNAIVPLDTLISFGTNFRGWAIDNLPNWFYVFEIGYWLQGPFMLWYLRSRFYKGYTLRGVDFFYLVPFLIVVFHQILSYHSLPTDVKMEIQRDQGLLDQGGVTIYFITFAREVLRLYFGVICMLELRNYLQNIDRKIVHGAPQLIYWLRFGVLGFTALWAWACVIAFGLILNVHFAAELPVGPMGLMANYGTCLLLSVLLVALAREAMGASTVYPQLLTKEPINPLIVHNAGVSKLPPVEPEKPTPAPQPPVNPEYVRRLDEIMTTKKIYLESSLTLEALSNELSVSPRTLSTILNRHYRCNFFEFINRHRIEAAKAMLIDPKYQNATMLDIMYEVGFNSKATFNNFFKKMEGLTPRDFKKKANAKSVEERTAVLAESAG